MKKFVFIVRFCILKKNSEKILLDWYINGTLLFNSFILN